MVEIMDKANITRHDLKHNFLTTGIVRLDYSGVISIEDKIQESSEYLREKGYTELEEGYIDQFSIKLYDPSKIETMRSISTEEFTRNKSYKFHNPDNKNIIEITKFFIILTINYDFYTKFENYITLFSGLANKLLKEQPFLKPLRIGSRKIATLFIYDNERINEYFESHFYVNPLKNSKIFDDKPMLASHNAIDTFNIDNISVNIIRNILKGSKTINGKDEDVFRVVFDIDCYSSGKYVSDIIKNDEITKKLEEFNNLDFDLYKNAVKFQFLKRLMLPEEFKDDNILEGVRRQ